MENVKENAMKLLLLRRNMLAIEEIPGIDQIKYIVV